MKIIPLTQGKTALVDDEMFDYLNQWKWCAHNNGGGFYALRNVRVDGKHRQILMHRLVASAPDGLDVDHINHNTLDNRRGNLRVCTTSQNKMNRGIQSSNRLGVKGVTPNGSGFRAYVVVNGKHVFDKTFRTLQEAKDAYDREAKKFHGEFFHP